MPNSFNRLPVRDGSYPRSLGEDDAFCTGNVRHPFSSVQVYPLPKVGTVGELTAVERFLRRRVQEVEVVRFPPFRLPHTIGSYGFPNFRLLGEG